MPKEINVRIPKPCGESWSNFRPTPGGGFCSSCRKEVIDFTSWQEKDIYLFLLNKQHNVCGRLRPEQLRTYTPDLPSRTGYKHYIMGLLGLLSLFPAKEGSAQTAPVFITEQHPGTTSKKFQPKPVDALNPLRKEFRLQGTVYDKETGEGIPGATVLLKGTKTGVNTDANGEFRLTVEGNENDKVVLEIRFIGYVPVEKPLILQEDNTELGKISLELDVQWLGEVVVIRKWSPRWIWWQIRSIF